MKLRIVLLVAASIAAPVAFAQQGGIGAVKVEPATAKVGQPVSITVSAEGDAPTFCGLRVEYGDGQSDEIKIASSEKQFPVALSRTYNKPGNYKVKAFGVKVTTHFPCMGTAEADFVVEAAAPAKGKKKPEKK